MPQLGVNPPTPLETVPKREAMGPTGLSGSLQALYPESVPLLPSALQEP